METERELPLKFFALVVQDGATIEVQIRVRMQHHDVPVATRRVVGMVQLMRPAKLEELVIDMIRKVFEPSC